MSSQSNNDDEVRHAAEILLKLFNCRCPLHTVYVEDSDEKKKEETCMVVTLSTPRFEDEQNCQNYTQSSPPFPSAPSCPLSKLPDKEHVTHIDDQPQSRCCSPPLPFHLFNEGVTPSTPRLEDEQNYQKYTQGSPSFPSAPSCSLSKLSDKEHVTRVDDQPQSRCFYPPLPFHPFNEGVVDHTSKGKGKGKGKSKVHQCKYTHCGKIFPSGQALGGHMREHYTGPPIKIKRKVVSNNGLQPEVKLEVVMDIDINMPLTYYEVGEASNSKQEEKVENHKEDELEEREIRNSPVENHKEEELEEGEIRDSPRSKHE